MSVTAPFQQMFLAASPAASPPPANNWHQLKIGSGGFVTGIQIATDGTKFCRTDTSGTYVRSPSASAWDQCNVRLHMPLSDAGLALAAGAYAIAIAPSNTNRFYMYTGNPGFYGYIFRSDDKGVTWARTNFASLNADPNDQGQPNSRLNGPYMAVDPVNPDIVYVSTPSSGLKKTTDGGTTWATVAGVGTAITPPGANMGLGHLICFDPTSTVTGGVTQGIYVSTYGTGVYHSTNGGTSWTLTTSTPTTHLQMAIGSNGVIWLVNNDVPGAGSLLRYNGTWSTQITSGTPQLSGVAVNPADANKVYAVDYHGNLYLTTVGGTTWLGPTTFTRSSSQIPWLSGAPSLSEAFAALAFDPSQANTLYCASGVGVWKTNPPTTNTNVVWTSDTAGIENIDGWYGRSIPGGPLLLNAQDRAIWMITDPSSYPSRYGPDFTFNAVDNGWGCDYAQNDINTIVTISSREGFQKSTDGGVTFTAGNNPPPWGVTALGGHIAAGSTTNIVWCFEGGQGPYYTLDGGTNWTQCTIANGGGNVAADVGWSNSRFINRVPLCRDDVTPTTYSLYNDGSGSNTEGVYTSSNGITFTRQASSTGVLGLFTAGPAKIRAVPGNAGHRFFSAGADQHASLPNTLLLYRSINGGANWAAVLNVKSVIAFGFGKAKPGGNGYPAVYILGFVNDVYGIWQSDDASAATPTWTSISDGYPLGIFDAVTMVEGDMNNYGRIVVGFLGTGFAYYG